MPYCTLRVDHSEELIPAAQGLWAFGRETPRDRQRRPARRGSGGPRVGLAPGLTASGWGPKGRRAVDGVLPPLRGRTWPATRSGAAPDRAPLRGPRRASFCVT